MAEYIEREALIERLKFKRDNGTHKANTFAGLESAIAQVKKAPTADVVEVRHGEWYITSEIYRMIDDVDEELFVNCPFCRRRYPVPYLLDDEKILEYAREEYPYCHCGAKMDGKGE